MQRETEIGTERDRERQRETHRERDVGRQRDRERQRHTERARQRQIETKRE